MASAFFFSTSAGENFIFGNEIYIHQEDPETDAEAYAFYIGNARGGQLNNNLIITNVTPIWVACGYGSATGTVIAGNKIIRSSDAETDFPAIRMGWIESATSLAKDIEFRSNEFEGLDFNIDATAQLHSYSTYWTLKVSVIDKKGKKVTGAKVSIRDKNGEEVLSQGTNDNGSISVELPEYKVDGALITDLSSYTVIVNNQQKEVFLNTNQEINMTISTTGHTSQMPPLASGHPSYEARGKN